MKRILVVLAMLAFVSTLAFSVSGKVYTRLLADVNGGQQIASAMGYYDSEPWVKFAVTPLADLRVGRQGTGVDINFDTFTLTYKIRRPLYMAESTWGEALWGFAAIYNDAEAITGMTYPIPNNGGIWDKKATSPGYLNISGIKAGPIDLGIGASWWTYKGSVDKFTTNAAGLTNVNQKVSASFDLIALDATYKIQLGDLSINAMPWNRVNFEYSMGSDSGYDSVTGRTNNTSLSTWGLVFPLNVDFSAEAFSMTVECKAFLNGANNNFVGGIASATTNISTSFGYEVGAVLKVNYALSELLGVFADAGIVLKGGSSAAWGGATTNNVTASSMFVPLLGGISISPASALTFNVGLGYQLQLSDTSLDATTSGTTVTTNNDPLAGADSRFQSEWDDFEIHGYHHPLVKFGADAKFASDWSAGLRFIIMLNDVGPDGYNKRAGTGNNNGYLDQSSHVALGHTTYGNWLNFQTIPDWDGLGGSSAYIGYDKDNFSAKAWVGVNNQGQVTPSAKLLSLFSAIDIGIKF